MSVETAIALMIACHAGISAVNYITLRMLEARIEKLMEGQALLIAFAAKGAGFLSHVQTVQVMACGNMDEETMQ